MWQRALSGSGGGGGGLVIEEVLNNTASSFSFKPTTDKWLLVNASTSYSVILYHEDSMGDKVADITNGRYQADVAYSSDGITKAADGTITRNISGYPYIYAVY